jgi:hypothetical protein
VVFIVVSDFEERVGFVDIDGIQLKTSGLKVKSINILNMW